MPQVESQCRDVQGDLSRKVKNELGAQPAEIPHNSMAVQQILQISELQFNKFTTPSSFLYWKIRFKTQVSSCADFPSEAKLWIKEVEMVDSVNEFKSSCSIQGNDFPNFEMLDARIASA